MVLGGGFEVSAIQLSSGGVDVMLVSDRAEMFIYPTSIWMITGEHRLADDVLGRVAQEALGAGRVRIPTRL